MHRLSFPEALVYAAALVPEPGRALRAFHAACCVLEMRGVEDPIRAVTTKVELAMFEEFAAFKLEVKP